MNRRHTVRNSCPPWMFIGVSFSAKRSLRRRIMSIAHERPAASGRWSLLGMLLVLIVGCAALTDKQPATARPAPEVADAAQTAAPPHYPPDWPHFEEPVTEAMRATREKLRQPISVRFDATPFSDAIEHLREVSDIKVAVNWRAIEAAGIESDTPVTVSIIRIPVEGALQQVLDTAAGRKARLSYLVDETGRLNISTADSLSRYTQVRSYDIRDLLVTPAQFGKPDLGTFGPHPAEPEQAPEPVLTTQERAAQIGDLIRDTIDPDNWREADGRVSSLNELNGTLIINTTPANHRDVGRLLNQIRQPRRIQHQVVATFLLVDDRLYQRRFKPLLTERREGETALTAVLDDAQVESLLTAVKADAQSLRLASPKITTFNGHRAYVQQGNHRAYRSDYERDEQTGKLEPTTGTTWNGILLDVTGTISRDHKALTSAIEARLDRTLRFREIRPPGVPADVPPLDAPEHETSFLKLTRTIPDKATLAIGGTTMHGNPLDPDSNDNRERHVVVLIKPTILLPGAADTEPLIPGAGVPQKAVLQNRD